jgi:hypothetical protein
MSTRKIIQIAATACPDEPDNCFVLCDDGSLWVCTMMGAPGEWHWDRFPDVPAKEEEE